MPSVAERAQADALRESLGSVTPWRPRAEVLAGALALASRKAMPAWDVQRVFSVCPPDSPAGESLFRLVEALPRTPDLAGRVALVQERLSFLRMPALAQLSLPIVGGAIGAVGKQFVYAECIEDALARAGLEAARDARRRYSFDMLGEGARTAKDAARNLGHYFAAIDASARAAAARGAGWHERFGVSIKLSSIHARYDASSYPGARSELVATLRALCIRAADARIGLTIDAEESERTALQIDLFTALAKDEALADWEGLGIAVQAYRPGALETLEAVFRLARDRRVRGAGKLCVRLVKGAYWDAEIKRAQELGLERYPVFTDKRATDLSYLACSRQLLRNVEAVFPQFAGHNPVTLGGVMAIAELELGEDVLRRRMPPFECQRLHGMGQGLDEAFRQLLPDVPIRVYAPVGGRPDLLAYLVRRLLENGASTSYVRQAASGKVIQASLSEAFDFITAATGPRHFPLPLELLMPERRVSRGHDLGEPGALAAMAKTLADYPPGWFAAPLVGGKPLPGAARRVMSPARPEVEIGHVIDATEDMARTAVAAAHASRHTWAATSTAVRAAMLERLADLIETDTPRLMSLCVWEAGKTIADALADVREAVDFCRYYAEQAKQVIGRPIVLPGPVGESNVLRFHGRGVFACISPWNFPVAIFTGQVTAALVAGNPVVAKPAEQTPLAAYRIAELILAAGVPGEVFHLVPGAGHTVGRAIVEDRRIAGVAFTGSNETANAIHRALIARGGPIVPFIAETGGLNAMIVDSTALPEQVVDAVVASAFRSAGQRCSSLRVLYLQNEIAPAIIEMLRGAMAALRIGDPSDPGTDIGPLIDERARRTLKAYVDELRARATLIGETHGVPAGGSFLAPVAFEIDSMQEIPGERFGPVLHVVRFPIEDLDRVVDEINACGYGLTLGVHTRVEARAEHIRRRAAVGNLYVNRNMIGAVVGVQPFGGEGLSGTGPKAGGPHYLARFATERVYTVNTAAAGGDLKLMSGLAQ